MRGFRFVFKFITFSAFYILFFSPGTEVTVAQTEKEAPPPYTPPIEKNHFSPIWFTADPAFYRPRRSPTSEVAPAPVMVMEVAPPARNIYPPSTLRTRAETQTTEDTDMNVRRSDGLEAPTPNAQQKIGQKGAQSSALAEEKTSAYSKDMYTSVPAVTDFRPRLKTTRRPSHTSYPAVDNSPYKQSIRPRKSSSPPPTKKEPKQKQKAPARKDEQEHHEDTPRLVKWSSETGLSAQRVSFAMHSNTADDDLPTVI